MNTNALLPLTAATLFALCAGSMVLSHHSRSNATVVQAVTAAHVADLPALKVRPDPADLAYFKANRAHRIVDLPAVKVTPAATDRAYDQATHAAERVVTLANVTVRPAAEDLAWYLSHQASQVASLEANTVRHTTDLVNAQFTAGALTLVRVVR